MRDLRLTYFISIYIVNLDCHDLNVSALAPPINCIYVFKKRKKNCHDLNVSALAPPITILLSTIMQLVATKPAKSVV